MEENNIENKDARTFQDLGVEPRLLQAIEEMGFVNPMPIQEMVIPHLLDKEGDVVGLAQTGTVLFIPQALPERNDVA